jgi:hypothetical protein
VPQLLDVAKVQLRKALISLMLPDDYPSWYAELYDALDKVDALAWDFESSVADNILAIQTAGLKIYNDLDAKLKELRAGDTRDIITTAEMSGCDGYLKVDMKWNASTRSALIAEVQLEENAPYYINALETYLYKYDESLQSFVEIDVEANKLLAEGKYRLTLSLYIDGENGELYRFPKITEPAPQVFVDGVAWGTTTIVDATYSAAYISSPGFELKKDDQTDIDSARSSTQSTQKVLREGRFYILTGDEVYDFTGHKVQ